MYTSNSNSDITHTASLCAVKTPIFSSKDYTLTPISLAFPVSVSYGCSFQQKPFVGGSITTLHSIPVLQVNVPAAPRAHTGLSPT